MATVLLGFTRKKNVFSQLKFKSITDFPTLSVQCIRYVYRYIPIFDLPGSDDKPWNHSLQLQVEYTYHIFKDYIRTYRIIVHTYLSRP